MAARLRFPAGGVRVPESDRTDRYFFLMEGITMASNQHTQDSQDQQFGKAAAEDQEWVDQLDDEGIAPDDLPDGPDRHPRAAGKAKPAE
jgi:hypothetical protein